MTDIIVNGNMLEDVELVIFDRDGTLIDLYRYWSQMIGKRAELICRNFDLGLEHKKKIIFEMGVDFTKKRIKPQGPVGLKSRQIVMGAAIKYLELIGIKDSSSICFNIFRKVDQWSLHNFKDLIIPIPGFFELFQKLKEKSCKIAIATTDCTNRAKSTMDFLGLTNQINFIVGADNVQNGKPAPDMINLILNGLNVERSKAIMVGDAMVDIEMGVNAKLKASVGVCTGLTLRVNLEKKTKYVIDNISQILVK